MTSLERDHFTKLCRRILESEDRRSFNECADELRLFLDAVLLCPEQKTGAAEIRISGVRALIFEDSARKISPANGKGAAVKVTNTRVT